MNEERDSKIFKCTLSVNLPSLLPIGVGWQMPCPQVITIFPSSGSSSVGALHDIVT